MSENYLIQELIKIRKEQKLSQADLANRANIKQQTISKAESKGGNPNLKTLCAMLEAMGYKIEFVLKDNDSFVINDSDDTAFECEYDDREFVKLGGISIDIDIDDEYYYEDEEVLEEKYIETYEEEQDDITNACSNCTYYKIAYPLGRCANPNHTMIGKYQDVKDDFVCNLYKSNSYS